MCVQSDEECGFAFEPLLTTTHQDNIGQNVGFQHMVDVATRHICHGRQFLDRQRFGVFSVSYSHEHNLNDSVSPE